MPTDGTVRQMKWVPGEKLGALVIVGESFSVQTCLFWPSAAPLRPSALARQAIGRPGTTANHKRPGRRTTMFPSLPSLAASVSQPFKRSQLGLFHGKTKQYGNNVPFSKNKTRRSWLPNVQSKRLFSDALGEMVRVKLTTRALKTIRKVRRTLCRCLSHHTTH
jgi:large subunit ribosomal protein L28